MTKQEMIAQLKEAQALFGNEISVLHDITVVPWEDLNLLEPVYDIDYAFSLDGVWSGYLTGMVTEWVADYDYDSGVFEEPYTEETVNYLEALNDFMTYYNDLDWNFDKAHAIISQVKNN